MQSCQLRMVQTACLKFRAATLRCSWLCLLRLRPKRTHPEAASTWLRGSKRTGGGQHRAIRSRHRHAAITRARLSPPSTGGDSKRPGASNSSSNRGPRNNWQPARHCMFTRAPAANNQVLQGCAQQRRCKGRGGGCAGSNGTPVSLPAAGGYACHCHGCGQWAVGGWGAAGGRSSAAAGSHAVAPGTAAGCCLLPLLAVLCGITYLPCLDAHCLSACRGDHTRLGGWSGSRSSRGLVNRVAHGPALCCGLASQAVCSSTQPPPGVRAW